MKRIEIYEHHGKKVAVYSKFKGQHRNYCLCYDCELFVPENAEKNCAISNQLFEFDIRHGVVTPVMECPIFIKKGN